MWSYIITLVDPKVFNLLFVWWGLGGFYCLDFCNGFNIFVCSFSQSCDLKTLNKFRGNIWTSKIKYVIPASPLEFSFMAWGKEELSPCCRLLGRDKRFRVFLPVFAFTSLYLGITPGSWSITPLQSGSPQWGACSPFRAVTEERQCSTPVGSSESFLCVIVSSESWDLRLLLPLWTRWDHTTLSRLEDTDWMFLITLVWSHSYKD